MSFEIRLRIAPRDAIHARKTTIGIVKVTVSDEDLVDVPEDTLAQIAEVLADDEMLEGTGVVDATFGSVVRGLEARVARRAAQAAAEDAARAEVIEAEARAAQEEAARRRQEALARARHADAITQWIVDNCDEEMVERRMAGFLKDDEIIEEAMDQIFNIPEEEHTPIMPYQACDCDKGCVGSVQSFVLSVEHLDTSQFATLEQIRQAAPAGAEVIPQMRKSACPACSCVPLVRMTALVRLPWNGWMLQKAYALG